MSGQSKRRLFSINNEYQARIVLLAVVPPLVIALSLTAAIFIMDAQFNRLVAEQSPAFWAQTIADWFYAVVYFVFFLLILSLIYSFIFAQNLVNPFGRVIREMDEVLASGNKRVITARPHDELANELLQRINAFIARMSPK